MSFAAPFVLLGLLVVPLLIRWYTTEQRRRVRAAAEFVTVPLRASVAPRGPTWRRHMPMLVFLLAVVALIAAAARPQQSKAVAVKDGAVMLVDDISSSMAARDVAPSRLGAAQRAADQFLSSVPAEIRVGLMVFNEKPRLLQSPTADRSLTRSALTQLQAAGHTAVGDAINAALRVLIQLRSASGKHVPGAIVLLSDGTSTTGANPLSAARAAASAGVPVYTVAVGTARGTITVHHGRRTITVPVPLSGGELAQIAALAKGRAFTAADTGQLSSVYAHLAKSLGHKNVNEEITSGFAGAGLALLLLGSAMSLRWFGRLV
jgi:Ca-activated chloride channel homolog